ncbi:MAG: hypothetical protein P4L53_00055 [Candidatus Obscuribacterales bacterium]|nr:hypothetical protein [Candidatus Obscuribacterales bacterium]
MTDLKTGQEVKHDKPSDQPGAEASKTDHARALSQACWERDKCDPKTITPEESKALHDLGQKAIDDIYKELKQNPPPETWDYDKDGHLLQAGDRVKASYDAKGNLLKAQIDDQTYEKVGNDVVETFKGNDDKMHTYTMNNVQDFSLKTVDGNWDGAFKSVDLEAKTANGSGMGEVAKIWETPEHSRAVSDFWQQGRQGEQKPTTDAVSTPLPVPAKETEQGHPVVGMYEATAAQKAQSWVPGLDKIDRSNKKLVIKDGEGPFQAILDNFPKMRPEQASAAAQKIMSSRDGKDPRHGEYASGEALNAAKEYQDKAATYIDSALAHGEKVTVVIPSETSKPGGEIYINQALAEHPLAPPVQLQIGHEQGPDVNLQIDKNGRRVIYIY